MHSYGALCTRFYDLDKPQAPIEGLRFYLPFLEAAKGPVLELMCGSGRYLEPFLAAGYDVDGMDASAEMLDACRRRIAIKWPTAGIFQQDITQLALPRRYRLAVCTSGSLSLLTDPDVVTGALNSIYSALLPGGTLVTEVEGFDPERTAGRSTHRRTVSTRDGGEIVLHSQSEYDPQSRIETAKSQYVLRRNGVSEATEDEFLDLRYYDEAEFESLLATAGFGDISCSLTYPETTEEQMGGVLLFACSRPI